MKHEIVVLWQLYDLLQRVLEELLKGLKKPAEADANKFSLEARKLMDELATLIRENFNLQGIR